MRKAWYILFCSCASVLFGQTNDRIVMIYQETVCPPSWVTFDNATQTLKNLEKELAKDSIQVFSSKFSGKPYETTCAGCQCLTGRNIEVTILRKDQFKLEDMNFHRPWIWMARVELIGDWTMDLDDEQIKQKMLDKNIHVQGLYGTGLSERKSDDPLAKSGRTITIKVEKDDIEKAKKEGFTWQKDFMEY